MGHDTEIPEQEEIWTGKTTKSSMQRCGLKFN